MGNRITRRPGRRGRKSAGATLGSLIVVIVVVLLNSRGGTPSAPGAPSASTGVQAILDAYRSRHSGVQVHASGTVTKILPDDADGDRHQRLIVALAGGHTVLIAHNIDLAPRIPAREGDEIEFQGDYEWSDEGGVIHWTHHDPARRREGGWIKHMGHTYE